MEWFLSFVKDKLLIHVLTVQVKTKQATSNWSIWKLLKGCFLLRTILSVWDKLKQVNFVDQSESWNNMDPLNFGNFLYTWAWSLPLRTSANYSKPLYKFWKGLMWQKVQLTIAQHMVCMLTVRGKENYVYSFMWFTNRTWWSCEMLTLIKPGQCKILT